MLHLATSYSHLLVEINLTCKEEATEEDYRCRIYSPNHLALVYRVDVVHLYTYITSRTRTIKHIEFHVLSLAERIAVLLNSNAKISFRNLAQGCQTRLESLFVAFEFNLKVSSERHVAESGNENCLRLGVRSCGHGIRQLVDVSEETSLKQRLLDSLTV